MNRISRDMVNHYLSILNNSRQSVGLKPISLNRRCGYYALETVGEGTGIESSRTGLSLREAYECIQAMITFS